MSRQLSLGRRILVPVIAGLALGATLFANGVARGASAPGSVSGEWLQIGPSTGSPPPRSGASMVYDAATGTTVLFGGFNGAFLDDTWVWDGAAWTPVTSPSSPPGRENASMAYDAATHTVVLFGGVGLNGVLGDTWTWNGTAWTPASASGPAPRSEGSMAYDAATHTVVLFGGQGASGPLADTWTWDGTTWTSSATGPASPPARAGGSMAYDAKHRDVVLFGGRGTNGVLGDTWTWDGAAWTSATVASPPGRYGGSLAYDGTIGELVLFAGTDGTSADAQTWLWNGVYWSSLTPANSPVPRWQSSMTYDAKHRDVVLFGGTDGASSFSDTWEFVTPATAPRDVRATSSANAQSVVTWTVPTSDGGSAITGYLVLAKDLASPTSAGTSCATSGATTCTVTGLVNGDRYTFSVVATTAVGAGASATSNVVVPSSVPSAPTIMSVAPANEAVTLSWSAPASTSGVPLVSYRAIARPGGASCHVPATAKGCVISGLRDGTRYTFVVYATNASGNGPASSPSMSVVVRATPGPPIITSARALRGRVVLHWRWPRSNGGSRVIGYDVYVGPASGGETTSPLNARLIRQRTFAFRGRKGFRTYIVVRAINAVGVGSASREVMVYTP